MSIAVTGMPNVVADVSASSALCMPNGQSGRTCDVTILAPVGADTFTATLYDGPSASGNVLGTGTTQQTVVASTPFEVAIAVSGVPYSLTVGVSQSSFTVGTPATASVVVQAYDYDENLITGTYATPVTLTDSDTTGTFTLSSTTVGSSSAGATLTYNGLGTTSATISASEDGVTPANVVSQTVVASLPATQFLYAAEQNTNAITVTLASGSGDIAPVRTISGSATTLNDPVGLAVDSSGNIYTENANGAYTASAYEIAVFGPTANGNVAPTRLINGADTGLGDSLSLAVDALGQIYASNQSLGDVTVYAPGASGDAVPSRTITAAGLTTPSGIAVDAAGLIYVLNGNGGTSGSPNALYVFAPTAGANATPLRMISGSATGLSFSVEVAVDSTGNAYVANADGNSITVFGPTQNGNVAPLRTISGSNTLLNGPLGLSLDRAGDLFVTNQNGENVVVFAPGATGNVAPTRIFAGSQTGFATPYSIVVGP